MEEGLIEGGTDVVAVHRGLSPGVPAADNETGWQMALDKLAAFVEVGNKLRFRNAH